MTRQLLGGLASTAPSSNLFFYYLLKTRSITSGVSQGAVLGPFLYILFTHDFSTSPHVTLAQFADDIAALCKASSSQLAAFHIQNLSHLIDDWRTNWRVSVNPTKSKLVPEFQLPVRSNISA